jgi:hypothetical protein
VRKSKHCFYEVNDRRARIPHLTPDSLAEVAARYRCPGHLCTNLSPRWHANPEPINIEIQSVPASQFDEPYELAVSLLEAAVIDVLIPYCRHMYFGEVTGSVTRGRSPRTQFCTVAAPKQWRIQSDRGRHCRHVRYECCDVYRNIIGWASGAIVERSLDDRLIYVDQFGSVLISHELAERLELKNRFPKLWLYRVDVVPEPLDGEVLPGDPGWDGVFRPAPPPVFPGRFPKRGRVTND